MTQQFRFEQLIGKQFASSVAWGKIIAVEPTPDKQRPDLFTIFVSNSNWGNRQYRATSPEIETLVNTGYIGESGMVY